MRPPERFRAGGIEQSLIRFLASTAALDFGRQGLKRLYDINQGVSQGRDTYTDVLKTPVVASRDFPFRERNTTTFVRWTNLIAFLERGRTIALASCDIGTNVRQGSDSTNNVFRQLQMRPIGPDNIMDALQRALLGASGKRSHTNQIDSRPLLPSCDWFLYIKMPPKSIGDYSPICASHARKSAFVSLGPDTETVSMPVRLTGSSLPPS